MAWGDSRHAWEHSLSHVHMFVGKWENIREQEKKRRSDQGERDPQHPRLFSHSHLFLPVPGTGLDSGSVPTEVEANEGTRLGQAK